LREKPEAHVERSRYVILPLGIAACVNLLLACTASEHDPAWRHKQELLMAEAVLLDLAEKPAESPEGARATVCIGVGENVGTSAQDPEPALLVAVRRTRTQALPASGCEMKGTLVRKGTVQSAVLLGVGRFEWKANDFVSVVGWRYVSPVAAAQWRYTLSFSDGRWAVDTSKLLSIS
jgi:hypothetical protein